MTEPSVQVPVSLIERLPHAPMCRYDRTDALAYRGERANCDCWKSEVLSQPTPSAECTCGYGGVHEPMNPRCERNGYRWTEPVSIADMAPGTSFGSTVDSHNTKVLRFMRTSEGTVDEDGTYWPVADIDPSTIRDVTPPPATPERKP